MADLQKTIQVIYAGEDKISGTLKSMGSNIDAFGRNVASATQPLADLTKSLVAAEAVMIGLAVGGLAVATREAGQFGDAFNEISTLIDAPATSLEGFRNNILEYTRDSSSSIDSINSAIYSIVSATGDWENSLTTLSAAEKLNIAGKGELEDTTKLLVSALNTYGAGAQDAADFSDVLFKTVKVGQTTLTELNASLGTVTGLAASAKVPFADLGAAMAALTGYIGNTSLATTQIKGILAAVVKPSEQAKKAAQELGIEFNTEALAAKGLHGFLQDVYAATDGNTTVMSKLFGRVEALNGALVLGQDVSGKFSAAMAEMEKRAGAVAEAYDKMALNFEKVNQRLVNNIKATLIDIGMPLLDDWQRLAESMGNIFEGISVGIDRGSFDELFAFIEETATEITETFNLIASNIPGALEKVDFTEFIKALEKLKDTVGETLADLLNLEPGEIWTEEGLAKIFQTLVDVGKNLTLTVDGIVKSFGPLVSKIGEWIDKAREAGPETFELAGKFLGMATQVNLVAENIPKITGALHILSGAIGLNFAGNLATLASKFINLGQAGSVATAGLLPFLGALSLPAGAALLGTWLRDNVEAVGNLNTNFSQSVLALRGLDDATLDALVSEAKHTEALGLKAVAMVKIKEALNQLPSQQTTTVALETSNFEKPLHEYLALVRDIPEEKVVDLKVEADQAEAKKEIDPWIISVNKWSPDRTITITANPDHESVTDTAKKIDEKLPSEKLMEVKIQGEVERDIAKINAQADVLKTAFEWKAKVDIADIEAATERITTISNNINSMFQNTGDVIGDVLDVFMNPDISVSDWLELSRLLQAESRRRDELVAAQIALAAAETKWYQKRSEALGRGDAMIQIKADGVYPELDLVLHEIVRRAQLQANAEGLEFLGL